MFWQKNGGGGVYWKRRLHKLKYFIFYKTYPGIYLSNMKAGKGKKVKITAKAKDGSGKYGTITIKIK